MTPPNLASTPSAGVAGLRLSPSALVLVAANLIPLAGVLVFGWTVFATLLLFWVENVIGGGFNILRSPGAQPQIGSLWGVNPSLTPFFPPPSGLVRTGPGALRAPPS